MECAYIIKKNEAVRIADIGNKFMRDCGLEQLRKSAKE